MPSTRRWRRSLGQRPGAGGLQLLRPGHRNMGRSAAFFGTEEHKERWSQPLLDGEIRLGIRDYPSRESQTLDATNARAAHRSIGRRVTNTSSTGASGGRRTPFTPTGSCSSSWANGRHRASSPSASTASWCSIDTPGVEYARAAGVRYQDRDGHPGGDFADLQRSGGRSAGQRRLRLPDRAKARLGPWPHPPFACESAAAARRWSCSASAPSPASPSASRSPFGPTSRIGSPRRASRSNVRLLTMKAARMMAHRRQPRARIEIAAIKVAAPAMAERVLDRAIQVHGGAGVSDDFPLAEMWAQPHPPACRRTGRGPQAHARPSRAGAL